NTKPATPSITLTTASPGKSLTPTITGSAEAGSTITVYKTSACTSTGTTYTQAQLASGIQVTVPDNTTTSISVTATDAAGNVSSCSNAVTYTADNSLPATPTFSLSPGSPNKSTSVTITGAAESGSTITLYTNGSCASTGTTYTQAQLAAGIALTVTDNATTTFSIKATDAAGNSSACSSAASYTADNISPGTPTITLGTTSPGKTLTPTITGSAETGATITLYKTAACTSTGTTYTQAQLAAGVTPTVTDNATTAFSVTATDAAGNVSGCSNSVSYTADNTAPAAPTGISISPVGPAKSTSPVIGGTAEAGSTVKIYATANCSGTAIATISATSFASGFVATVGANSTTSFTATATDAAGNVSSCSIASSYTADNTAPAAPSALTFTPASPAKSTTPVLKGAAEAGSTVRIYSGAGCMGTLLDTIGAAAFASSGAEFTVDPDSTNTYSVSATDVAGNTSVCSSAAIYVADNTAPGAPTITLVTTSPGKTLAPTFSGSAETGATITLYRSADCGGSGATYTQAQLATGVQVTVPDNAATSISVKATDAAGNPSACSNAVTYTADNAAPVAPSQVATSPDSPSQSTTPTVSGAAEDGSQIKLYRNGSCSGAAAVTITAAEFATGYQFTTLADEAVSVTATATDAAGNTSACSAAATYVADNTAPNAPDDLGAPNSPARSTSPHLTGSAEANSTVSVYKAAACGGAKVGDIGAADFASTGFEASVAADATSMFSFTSTDRAGNTSACSGSISYTTDNTAPVVPSNIAFAGKSPSKATTVTVSGHTEADASVHLYDSATCVGNPAVKVDADSDGDFSFTYSVGPDGIYSVSAIAEDALGNASACSSAATYVSDNTAPAAPSGLTTDPGSPGALTNIAIIGSAESGSTVAIFDSGSCFQGTGKIVAAGSAADFAAGKLRVNVAAGSTNTFSAFAADSADNYSACSAPLSYTQEGSSSGGGFSVSAARAESQCLGTLKGSTKDSKLRFLLNHDASVKLSLWKRTAPKAKLPKVCPSYVSAVKKARYKAVTTGKGKKKKKIAVVLKRSLGAQTINLMSALKVKAKSLPAGYYRIRVDATDTAGNTSGVALEILVLKK
ncbi:MAG: Ig-like domain-containing protein, partial [Solirubrobacterales bacterium]